MIFSPSDIKTMMLRTNEQLLTEILNNFEYFFSSMLYSKEHSSILITLKNLTQPVKSFCPSILKE